MRPSRQVGEFGTCEGGGRAIDADRPRVRPAARLCVKPVPVAETLA
jgi:RNA polymerase-binding transcription factor DksA